MDFFPTGFLLDFRALPKTKQFALENGGFSIGISSFPGQIDGFLKKGGNLSLMQRIEMD